MDEAMNIDIFQQSCPQFGIPMPQKEHRWHPVRKFRADYAWPEFKLILEVEGGVWSKGKHGRGSGIIKDMEKSNEAAMLGWRTLRCLPKELHTAKVREIIKLAMEA